MVSVDKAVIARITKKGVEFEVLVDPYGALEIRKGRPGSIENILAVNQVFKNSRKGEKHNSEDLIKAFGTTDVFRIAEEIVKHGDVQLTTEQRHKLTEDKRNEIAHIISRQGIDPKSKLPHPPLRIMNAMREARVQIDPFKPASEQVKAVLEKIQEIIPISLERMEIAIKVSMEHAGKASTVVREMAEIKKEEWTPSGWIAVIEIPAGIQADIYDRLNKITGGKVEVKIIKEHKI